MTMGRDYKSGFERQPQDFYATPAWVTEALLKTLLRQRIRLPNGIWEPCCGMGDMSRVLEAHGHSVVSTDLDYRGYGEGGRDFMMETSLPDGVTAIVTNPPYALYGQKRTLHRLVDHALDLTRPVGGMVALLVNNQWKTGAKNSRRCLVPAYEATVVLPKRIRWFEGSDGQGKENHVWLVWDHSRKPGPPKDLIASDDPESEPARRSCIVCRAPLPSNARADKRHCSATCRKRDSRRRSPSTSPDMIL
jgi:hypothetical protein